MRRLFGIVAIALASCITPADTAAQGQCRPEAISGTGTAFPYVVMAQDQAGDWLIRSRHSREATAIDAARDSSYLSPDQLYLVRSTFEMRWRDRQGRDCTPGAPAPPPEDTVPEEPTPPPPPPPPEDTVPEEPAPPPPDTADAPPDTAALVAPASLRFVAESNEWWAAWAPVSGAEDHVVSWLGRDSVTTNGPNASGEIWMMLGATGTLEGEEVCAAGRVAGVAGPETCGTISDVEPPPDDGGGGGGTNPARPGTGWSPQGTLLCDEDFTRFADWAAFMSGAQCISNKNRLDGWGRLNIDVDQNGLWYRYREDPTRCGDQIVGQANIPLPAGTREVWMEFTTQFSANFDTRNPGCSRPAPDFKYVLVWVPGGNNGVPCGNGRAEIKMGTNGGQIAASIPGFSQCDDVKVNPDGSTMTVRQNGADQYFDGQPHTYRVSFRALGGDDWHVFVSIDGVTTHDYITNSINAVDFDRIMMGSNRNLGAVEDMFLHWQAMKVWAR